MQTLQRSLIPLTLLLLASGCKPSQSAGQACGGAGSWNVQMRDTTTPFTVSGTIQLTTTGGSTQLTSTSREGTGEPLNFPIESLVRSPDSIRFRFAPLGFHLAGRCISADSIAGTFNVPQPPFQDMKGMLVMRRTRS